MNMQQSASATSSASLVASGVVAVTGVYVRAAGTAGTVVLKDGGSSGTVKLTINTPAAVSGIYIPIPENGLQFKTDVYAALTTADAVTIFYRRLRDL